MQVRITPPPPPPPPPPAFILPSHLLFYFLFVLFIHFSLPLFLPLLLSSDVLWCVSDTIDFEKVRRGQMTNQCSNERVITFKNHLAETVMRVFGDVSLPLPLSLSPLFLSLPLTSHSFFSPSPGKMILICSGIVAPSEL